ncbi:MAG: tryptophan 2,3-dioxygenase family protein [Cytophagaceae bacterium]
MQNQDKDKEKRINQLLGQLEERYSKDGQDLSGHLEGLLNSRYINYWDYIRLDTLLSLQNPVTDYPDEFIFITYHQITELYFKMVLHELKQLRDAEQITTEFFQLRLNRANWFFGQLIQSFDIIAVGMEQEQFLKFRTALHPASGFQSVQYRLVELASSDLINLVDKDHRDGFDDYSTIDQMFEKIYWKQGAIDKETGKKTLTLKLFEEKYTDLLLRTANEWNVRNLYSCFKKLPFEDQKDPALVAAMKTYDAHVNINWPLAHYKYAVSYLIKSKKIAPATGGTNWLNYLPPKFQKRVFFPSLYTETEIEEWGRKWVETEVFSKF